MTNPAEQDKLASDAQTPVAPVTKNAGRGNAMKGLFWYGLARLLLFLVLFFILLVIIYLVGVRIPAAITAVFALIIAMPLSVFVFPKLRVQANESVAVWSENRRAHKEYIAQQIKDREEN
ncbi:MULTISPECIES: DUF4229 domain-containing protein [Corynebacterium]|uniref:DUF4229 domain-containing protein n=1 Tax=Corynebacterium TaxID=1716 RepID=UPI0008A26A12|nr:MULTISPECIES: DUF4229 domain-containing protein [Corynebacterium]MBC6758825.1 DUF4229 domain-containing protein [Corynebacterium sp. LK24]MCT1718527.1 DUF4229 domain-containing protein [Corynebacterium amycolatum]OFN07028.1 hypothetical protein HMPREF2614_09020 [Corynebacterium sp. HMSC074C11]